MKQNQQLSHIQVNDSTAAYKIMNLNFDSKKTFLDFLRTSISIIVVPIILVISTHLYIKDNPSVSELYKVAITVVPAVIFMNIVMGIYVYKAIKDPQNYQKPVVNKKKTQKNQ